MKKVKKSVLLFLVFLTSIQLQAGTVNLLTNPGAENGYVGWNKTDAGSGWGIWGSDVSNFGSCCWIGSYDQCSLTQKVSLTEKGFSEATLDSVKPITFGAYVGTKSFGEGRVNIYVELLDANDSVVGKYYVCDNEYIAADAPWALKRMVLKDYGKGVRAINFKMTSEGSRYWAGNYAPMLDDAFLSIPDDYLHLSYNSWHCSADGASDTLTYVGSDSVKVCSDVNWATVKTSNDSIFVNVHKNTVDSVRTAYITVASASDTTQCRIVQAAGKVNLLSNPGAENAYTDWTEVDNGGQGWDVKVSSEAHSGNAFWAPSYLPCKLKQNVSLRNRGLTDAQLDLAPPISMGAFVHAGSFCGGPIFIYAEFLDETGSVLSTQYVSNYEDISDDTPWTLKDSTFENYGAGVRSINFYLAGDGSRAWEGHYAPCFDDAFINVAGATVTGLTSSKCNSSISVKNSMNKLSVDMGDLSGVGSIYVYDMQGKLVLTGKTSGKTTVLGLSLEKGIYIVKVKAGSDVVSRKIAVD